MNIREAKPGDEVSIARVVVDTWRSTYKGIVPQDYLDSLSYETMTDAWHRRITDKAKLRQGWFILVAEDTGGLVIGFAGGGPEQGYGLPFTGELGFIYLLESHQRQGIGRQLAATVASRLQQQNHKSMLVWVFTENPYRAFYESLGGRAVAERVIEKYGGHLPETAYGWDNINPIVKT